MRLARFFLLSAAVHIAIFFFPDPFSKKTGEQVLPITLVFEDHGKKISHEPPKGKITGKTKETKAQDFTRRSSEQRDAQRIQPTGRTDKTQSQQHVRSDPSHEVGVEEEIAAPQVTKFLSKELPSSPVLREEQKGNGRNLPQEVGAAPTIFSVGMLEKPEEAAPAPFVRVNYAYNPTPQYPEKAQKEGWEGTVLLRVLVNAQGMPETIEINQSSGFEVLDRAAQKTVTDWRFQPARMGGEKIASWVKIPVVFQLTEQELLSSAAGR